MKILFTMMSMQKGGAERVIANLSNYMINENEIILVPLLNENIAYKLDSRIKIIPINKKHENRTTINKILNKISIVKLNQYKKTILRENPDVIISFLPEPSFKILFLKKINKKLKKIPIIVSVRNDPVIEYRNKIIHYIMKKLYPLADGFVFQTNDAKKYFENIIKCKNVVIPNPVSNDFIIERYIGEREKRIVTVGRLEPQKNHKLLIDVFNEVHKKHRDYILEIYGDGSLRQTITNYIKSIKAENYIVLKGNSNNIQQDIYKAKAFVMTSDYEGMPNALLEAFCLGVPCISTDCPCGGPREIIKNGKNGFLIKNKEQLILAINNIIENSIEENISKCANAQQIKYKIEIIAKEWEDFLKICRKEK